MDARVEAARWFAARRRGVMALEERNAYEQWVEDEDNRAALTEMDELWASLEQVSGAESCIEPRRLIPSRMSRKFMVAIVSIVSFGIGLMSFIDSSNFWTSLDWVNR
jgi:ferric-dicitrate binding protein FerR (iron transport regulator)